MLLKAIRSEKGAAYLYALFLAVVILFILGAAGMGSRQNLYDAQTQQLNNKAYYLAREAAEIGISAMLTQKVSGKDELSENFLSALTPNPSPPITLYNADGEELGTATLKLTKENDKPDGSGDDWAVIYITIRMDDYRIPLHGTSGETPKSTFEYYFMAKVLCKNTNKRSFDVITEDKAI